MKYIDKMKNLVEISKIVTESDNFYEIKDLIINKMLGVVHPTKACVNLFYGDDFRYAHLVCSATLDHIPSLFPQNEPHGSKIDFSVYPQYIHDAVREKKQIIIDNIFEDERAKGEEEMALKEKYVGRAVFPFVLENKTVGFMTCYTKKDEKLEQSDIDFISQVASLMTLSISITEKNQGINNLVRKLRSSINNINKASIQMYSLKDLNYYLSKMTSVLRDTLHSKYSIIILYEKNTDGGFDIKTKSDVSFDFTEEFELILNGIINSKDSNGINNNINMTLKDDTYISSYIYHRIIIDSSTKLLVLCAGDKEYSNDDANSLSILIKQISMGIHTYEFSIIEEKHKDIENDLSILRKQQRLIMDSSNIQTFNKKEMFFYHEPAKIVGGDFYHAIELEDRISFIVADVMGHGVASNYIVAMIKGAFDILVQYSDSPKEILSKMNDHLFDEFDEMGIYATAIVGVFSKRNFKMNISSAGHYFPFITYADGTINHDQEQKRGLPIGIVEHSTYYNIEIDGNNISDMCFYTDGILEMQNEKGEEFGEKRLEQFLIENYKKDKDELLKNIKALVDKFIYNKEKKDDILMVFLKNKK